MAQLDPAARKLEQQIEAVESRVDRLRNLYEMYFQGIERIEPSMERNAVKGVLSDLRKSHIRNTALRFRINQLVARVNSYENYWNRVCRAMEDGTYHKDLFMARFRNLRKSTQAGEATKDHPASETAKPPSEAGSRPAPPPARDAGGFLNDQQVGAIYDALVLAKRRCKESTAGITRNAVANSLRKQVPTIMKQYKCRSVEFKVVIKKGKAVLKAVPKF